MYYMDLNILYIWKPILYIYKGLNILYVYMYDCIGDLYPCGEAYEKFDGWVYCQLISLEGTPTW